MHTHTYIYTRKHMHTYARIRVYMIYTYTRRTCRPPPRRKLPFAVNLIRVLPPSPPHCPSYERVTDARWPFRLCTHNFIPPGRRTVVWRRIRRRRVSWLADDLFVYVVLCVAFTFPAKRAFQKHFPLPLWPPPCQSRDDTLVRGCIVRFQKSTTDCFTFFVFSLHNVTSQNCKYVEIISIYKNC